MEALQEMKNAALRQKPTGGGFGEEGDTVGRHSDEVGIGEVGTSSLKEAQQSEEISSSQVWMVLGL